MTEKTYTATIYVGFKEHYSGVVHTTEELRVLLQQHVDKVKLCVSLVPIEFIYTNGSEPGAAVGLINYPRFPCSDEELRGKALRLAGELVDAFKQYRISVVFPDQTEMVAGPPDPETVVK